MRSVICVLFLFALSVRAESYYSAIPCRNDQTCHSVLVQPSKAMCLNGICMCANTTSMRYEYCSNKDIVVGARFGGEDRNCSSDADCEHIQGAKCFKSEQDPPKLGTCDCQSNMVMGKDNRHCLPIIDEVMKRCKESIQCTAGLEGAECVENFCKCRADFHYTMTKKRCIPNKVYGEACTREEESCYQIAGPGVNALGCSEKLQVCKCRRNYRLLNGLCQPSGMFSGASRSVIQLLPVAAMVIFTVAML